MDILLAIIGIILLIKGNIKVTSKSELSKNVGRILGVLTLLPFIAFFLLGLLKLHISENFSIYLGYVMFGGVILAAITIAFLFRKPIGVTLSQSASPPPPSLKPELSIVTTQPTSQTSPPRAYRFVFQPTLIVIVVALLLVGGGVVYFYLQIPKMSREATKESKLPSLMGFKKSSKPVEVPPDFSVASVISAVVQLQCFNGDFSLVGRGSGTSFYDQGQHWIATNAHVVRINNEFGGCYVYFPQADGTFYDSAYWAGEVYFYDDKKVVIDGVEVGGTTHEDGGLDYALLKITDNAVTEDGKEFPHYKFRAFPDVFKSIEKTCSLEGRTIQIGERVFIVGYPAIGGADMTITEGIVSGFEGPFKEWIKTSAKVEQGHSGGLAVLAKDGCMLGIPSLSFLGQLESIARILTFQFINTFIGAVEITQ